MSDFGQWAIAGMLGAVFLAANGINTAILMGKWRGAEGRAAAPVVLVGGIAGAMSFALSPSEALRAWYWLPLVIDLGSGPLFAVALAAVLLRAWRARDWLHDLPFVHYLVAAAPESPRPPYPRERAIVGCLLGTAVGDALGLACEGLSRRRQARLFPRLDGYRLLPFGKGMCSDDTEHACMLAQSLIATAHFRDPDGMGRRLGADFAWRLRFWLLGLPAGIGLATLRAILKLWLGIPARSSGVNSAGNAPAMRSALIGVCHGTDVPRMRALVHAATRITHNDARAQNGAQAVALAAYLAATRDADIAADEFIALLAPLCERDAALGELMRAMALSVARGESAAAYAASLGCAKGVSGYMYHTVPVALQIWLRRQTDFRGALIEAVRLGGDTDTVGAVIGALIGARVGKEGIPAEWLRDLWEWPRTTAWMERLGARLARSCEERASAGVLRLNWIELALRNLLFVPLVLAHGLRRLLPPY
ncbi:MAG: ADP-ribosylglycohydrolase family protein [Burkholderiales bacterium]|nr:ADP-ribosylglycohydrolase family protein [Burkholderiales bacterium]